MSNFILMCIEGEAMIDEIDDFVDKWHDSEDDGELYDYLGLTKGEYALWVKSPDMLPFIVTGRMRDKNPLDVMEEVASSMAARASTAKKARTLEKWLETQKF